MMDPCEYGISWLKNVFPHSKDMILRLLLLHFPMMDGHCLLLEEIRHACSACTALVYLLTYTMIPSCILQYLCERHFQVVSLWDLHQYTYKKTIPTYEVVEAVCIIPAGTPFAECIGFNRGKASPGVHFITVGERGIVRIWKSEG